MKNKCTITDFKDILGKMYGLKRTKIYEYNFEDKISSIDRAANLYLTARQKECFFMYYEHKKNMRTISEELGVSMPTVCRHLQRGRKRIFRYLKNNKVN